MREEKLGLQSPKDSLPLREALLRLSGGGMGSNLRSERVVEVEIITEDCLA